MHYHMIISYLLPFHFCISFFHSENPASQTPPQTIFVHFYSAMHTKQFLSYNTIHLLKTKLVNTVKFLCISRYSSKIFIILYALLVNVCVYMHICLFVYVCVYIYACVCVCTEKSLNSCLFSLDFDLNYSI